MELERILLNNYGDGRDGKVWTGDTVKLVKPLRGRDGMILFADGLPKYTTYRIKKCCASCRYRCVGSSRDCLMDNKKHEALEVCSLYELANGVNIGPHKVRNLEGITDSQGRCLIDHAELTEQLHNYIIRMRRANLDPNFTMTLDEYISYQHLKPRQL